MRRSGPVSRAHGNSRKYVEGNSRRSWCNTTTRAPPAYSIQSSAGDSAHLQAQTLLCCPGKRPPLITAATAGGRLFCALIGCRTQLRTADGEFVNDLDSSQSSGRGLT